MPLWQRIGLLGITPPAAGTSRLHRLRFVRDLQRRTGLMFVPVFVVLLLTASGTIAVVAAVIALLAGLDNALLARRVARIERAGPPPT